MMLSRPLAAFVLLAAAPAFAASTFGELEFEPCVLTAAGMPRPVAAQCSRLLVAENPANPGGPQIELALAWIPVEGPAEPDPVFFLAGGPGQGARDSYPMVAQAFADIRRSRHILLLDQRGTGGSRPLFCPEEEDEMAVPGLEEFSPQKLAEFTARCRDELQEFADLRHYTTSEAVHDLEQVRVAIGAERLNLVGVSYGTRVAQQYARAHPQRVRTLILDSVVPNDLALGAEHARNLQDALDAQFARCRQTPACREAFGDPAARLEDLLEQLRRGGLAPVRYRDPASGAWREESPSFEHLAGLLRMYAYSPLTAAMLPLIIHQAGEGDYTALLAMVRMMARDLGGQIATGMHNSVVCTEDVDRLERRGESRHTLLGDRFIEYLQGLCAHWPRGERPAGFRDPLSGEMPVLLISGEYDPVTPPRYGDGVAAGLRHARHVVLRGQGHSVLGAGCMPKLAAQFIERADALGLDASCLDRLAAPPPFAGMHGWDP
jgi:pimeloyl-ACP methyl ester carboxylesterase